MTQLKTYLKILCSLAFQSVVVASLAFLFLTPAYSQGWEKSFGGNKEDQANEVIHTIDHGYLVVGFTQSFSNGADQDIDIYVIKTDVDGTLVWEKTFDPGAVEYGSAALQTDDLGFIVAGHASFDAQLDDFQAYLLKISDDGKQEWDMAYDNEGAVDIRINDITKSSDGGFLMVGSSEDEEGHADVFLLKVGADGTEEWRKTITGELESVANAVVAYNGGYVVVGGRETSIPPPNGSGNDALVYFVDQDGDIVWEQLTPSEENVEAKDVIVTLDGNIAVAGFKFNSSDMAIWKYDANGTLLWETVEDAYGMGDEVNSIIQLESDGSLVVAGSTELNDFDINFLLAKFTPDGDLIWVTNTGDVFNTDFATSIAATQQGGFIFTGYNGFFLNFVNSVSLTLTDGEGSIYTSYIRGNVFHDQDEECDPDNGEPPFQDWLVRARGIDKTFFGSSDENGDYLIRVDTGEYIVEAVPANSYWESCLPNGVNMLIDNFYDTTTVNFPIKAKTICPFMEVDISTPFLASCNDVVYTVDYANAGPVDANGVFIEVLLGDSINFIDASLPWTQDGNTYTFDIGDMPYNTSGSFIINTFLPCDGIATGQAGLVSAHIYPDTICADPDPQWDGSSIKVTGVCLTDVDSVEFRIENISDDDMTEPRPAFIIEEDLVVFMEQFQLDGQMEKVIRVEADGATMRIVAEQSEGHPGNSLPTVAIEGCVEDGMSFSTGYVTDWPEDDKNASISIHVDEFIESQEEISLVAHPRGYQDTYIHANTDITYRYLFRNIGTDTVARVVIRDTLSQYLDITSIIPGASSHQYDLEAYHTGVIKITFDDIELPNAASPMDPNSFGYVELKIQQNQNNPIGTVIENQAYVIFDYYEPVQSNTYTHVIKAPDLEDFLINFVPHELSSLQDDDLVELKIDVKAYPNPTSGQVILEVEGWPMNKSLDLIIYNSAGQLIKQDVFRNNQYILPASTFSVGTYIYSLKHEGALIGGGTLIVR